MAWSQFGLLVLAGLAAGFLNVAAAAGAPLSFVALTLLGLPVDVANATNLTAMPASFGGGFRRAWRNRATYVEHWPVVAVAAAGCLIGVAVVTVTGNGWLPTAAPYFLVAAAVLIVAQPRVTGLRRRPRVAAGAARADAPVDEPRSVERFAALSVPMFLTGLYAGAFGGGVGAMVVAVLLVVGRWSVMASNDAKIVICLATSAVGAVAFGVTGNVAWGPCAAVAVGMAVGGYLGGLVLDHVWPNVLRVGVAVVSVGAAVWMLNT